MSGPANYQIAFPKGPLLVNGTMTIEWQRFFLWIWNRTGGALGTDMSYEAQLIDQAQIASSLASGASATALKQASDALDLATQVLHRAMAIEAQARKALAQADDCAIIAATTKPRACPGNSEAALIYAITQGAR